VTLKGSYHHNIFESTRALCKLVVD